MIRFRFWVFVILTGGTLVYAWWTLRPKYSPVSVPVIARPAIKDSERVTIQTPIKVYTPKAKKKAKIPQSMKDDSSIHLVSSSSVKADTHPHTISTVVDAQTGNVTTYDVRDPLPWIAINPHGEAGIGYGWKYSQGQGLHQATRLIVRQNLLDVKAAKISLQGSIDPQDREAFAGVFLTASW